ncbi:unnamed protein product [Amoebophrya sp. A120]|nr:unnamed protein product [Amoebophrya sp. A120]|eukprot:GSA120T00014540001.1
MSGWMKKMKPFDFCLFAALLVSLLDVVHRASSQKVEVARTSALAVVHEEKYEDHRDESTTLGLLPQNKISRHEEQTLSESKAKGATSTGAAQHSAAARPASSTSFTSLATTAAKKTSSFSTSSRKNNQKCVQVLRNDIADRVIKVLVLAANLLRAGEQEKSMIDALIRALIHLPAGTRLQLGAGAVVFLENGKVDYNKYSSRPRALSSRSENSPSSLLDLDLISTWSPVLQPAKGVFKEAGPEDEFNSDHLQVEQDGKNSSASSSTSLFSLLQLGLAEKEKQLQELELHASSTASHLQGQQLVHNKEIMKSEEHHHHHHNQHHLHPQSQIQTKMKYDVLSGVASIDQQECSRLAPESLSGTNAEDALSGKPFTKQDLNLWEEELLSYLQCCRRKSEAINSWLRKLQRDVIDRVESLAGQCKTLQMTPTLDSDSFDIAVSKTEEQLTRVEQEDLVGIHQELIDVSTSADWSNTEMSQAYMKLTETRESDLLIQDSTGESNSFLGYLVKNKNLLILLILLFIAMCALLLCVMTPKGFEGGGGSFGSFGVGNWNYRSSNYGQQAPAPSLPVGAGGGPRNGNYGGAVVSMATAPGGSAQILQPAQQQAVLQQLSQPMQLAAQQQQQAQLPTAGVVVGTGQQGTVAQQMQNSQQVGTSTEAVAVVPGGAGRGGPAVLPASTQSVMESSPDL